jgi:Starvation-inducible outer membrane lipoprotein
VTFIGRVTGYETTRIGEYDYQLPRLQADVVYLWPVQREVEVVPAYPYGPWGPRWGWGYRGWW